VALKWLLMPVKVEERFFPSVDTDAMITTAISAAIRPYSSAVTPFLSRLNALILAASLHIFKIHQLGSFSAKYKDFN
jgi:hypothetical protein